MPRKPSELARTIETTDWISGRVGEALIRYATTPEIGRDEQATLVALITFVDWKSGQTREGRHPSRAALAERAKIGTTSLDAAIASLIEKTVLVRIHRSHRNKNGGIVKDASAYRLRIPVVPVEGVDNSPASATGGHEDASVEPEAAGAAQEEVRPPVRPQALTTEVLLDRGIGIADPSAATMAELEAVIRATMRGPYDEVQRELVERPDAMKDPYFSARHRLAMRLYVLSLDDAGRKHAAAAQPNGTARARILSGTDVAQQLAKRCVIEGMSAAETVTVMEEAWHGRIDGCVLGPGQTEDDEYLDSEIKRILFSSVHGSAKHGELAHSRVSAKDRRELYLDGSEFADELLPIGEAGSGVEPYMPPPAAPLPQRDWVEL